MIQFTLHDNDETQTDKAVSEFILPDSNLVIQYKITTGVPLRTTMQLKQPLNLKGFR